ncbi:hypothetical protein J007_05319 [Cryptococcus neoformans]|nr:hypothetical protein C356_05381 [Cryptococcus neoformans var. grubii c45]OXB34945.1 hypothetical protein J007_05319 [Cryptococcus neoformans var. grubii]OXC59089.1 hypothetical protein C358_05434 [Cryptococcus neoformans var. grubii MW-RSA852]
MITQPSCRHYHLLVSLCPLLGHPDNLSAAPHHHTDNDVRSLATSASSPYGHPRFSTESM